MERENYLRGLETYFQEPIYRYISTNYDILHDYVVSLAPCKEHIM